MPTELQSNVLTANTVKNVMPSCMVYIFVMSATFLVDTVVSGHFLGTDAVAAVAMGLPIIGLMIAFTIMILQGGFLKMLVLMGRSDMEGYQRIFSLALSLSILIDLVFLALCFFGAESLVNLCGGAKATAQAAAYGRLYIRTASPMVLFFCIGSLFQLVLTTYGYQNDRTICSIVNVTSNVIISVIAIAVLPEEIKIVGLGIGSAAGAFAQMITAYILMKRKQISVRYRLYPLNRENLLDTLDCIRRGLPSSIDIMMDSACSSIVNNIILAIFLNGTGVLSLVTVIKTLGSLVRTVGKGAMYSSEPLVAILFGARDKEGIKKVFRFGTKLGLIYAAAVGALLFILQTPLLSFYQVNDSLDAHIGLSLVACSGLVYVFPCMYSAVYEATGHLMLSLLMAAVPDSILYPILVGILGKALGVTGIWIAYGYNFIFLFAFYYLLLMLIYKKVPVPLDAQLMLGKMKNCDAVMDVSIPTDAESVSYVAESLQKFFMDHGSSKKNAYFSALCMEEIAADYLAYRRSKAAAGKKTYMDIKAFCDGGRIELILRNYDDPYNPLIFEPDPETFSKIGVSMVQKIAEDITYGYTYHLNVVSVVLNAEG